MCSDEREGQADTARARASGDGRGWQCRTGAAASSRSGGSARKTTAVCLAAAAASGGSAASTRPHNTAARPLPGAATAQRALRAPTHPAPANPCSRENWSFGGGVAVCVPRNPPPALSLPCCLSTSAMVRPARRAGGGVGRQLQVPSCRSRQSPQPRMRALPSIAPVFNSPCTCNGCNFGTLLAMGNSHGRPR